MSGCEMLVSPAMGEVRKLLTDPAAGEGRISALLADPADEEGRTVSGGGGT